MTKTTCPRCGDSFDGRYPAVSRATTGRDIYVCGPCGQDEASRLQKGDPLPRMAQWPVARKYDTPMDHVGRGSSD